MKFNYQKKRINYFLIFGLIWLFIGIAFIIIKPENIFSYGWLFVASFYIGNYFYMKKHQYLSLKNDTVFHNRIFPKPNKIKLSELKEIKRVVTGDYVLKSENAELKINSQLIDKESLEELLSTIKKYTAKNNINQTK